MNREAPSGNRTRDLHLFGLRYQGGALPAELSRLYFWFNAVRLNFSHIVDVIESAIFFPYVIIHLPTSQQIEVMAGTLLCTTKRIAGKR